LEGEKGSGNLHFKEIRIPTEGFYALDDHKIIRKHRFIKNPDLGRVFSSTQESKKNPETSILKKSGLRFGYLKVRFDI